MEDYTPKVSIAGSQIKVALNDYLKPGHLELEEVIRLLNELDKTIQEFKERLN